MKRTLLAGLAAGLMLFGASSTYAAPPPSTFWWAPFTEFSTLITISGFIVSTVVIRDYVHNIRVGPYGGQ
jgi:hypothetical protein